MAVFGAIITAWITESIKNKPKVLDDKTKVYETIKHKYGIRPAIFGLFQFSATVIAIIAFSVFTFCGDTAEFWEISRGLDFIAPLSVFFVLAFIV